MCQAKWLILALCLPLVSVRSVQAERTHRAVFEYSTTYSYGYTYPEFRRYIDVYRGQIVKRVWIDDTFHATCYDDDQTPHRSFLIPGQEGESPTLDTYVILDMLPYQCPRGSGLRFSFPDNTDLEYLIEMATVTNGQMRLIDPR